MKRVSLADDWATPEFKLESKFLEGRLLFVPEKLFEEVDSQFNRMRIELRELTCLIWTVIKDAPREHKRSKWKRIHHTSFNFNASTITVRKALQWLVDNEFIEVPPGRQSYQKGAYSRRFCPVSSETGQVLVELEVKSVLDGIQRFTHDDEACRFTRECLDALQIDKNALKLQLRSVLTDYQASLTKKRKGGQLTKERSLFAFGLPLLALHHKCGRVIRGPKGNRLYSPFTGVKKVFRHCFSFNGDTMTIWDAQAAQPCLTANLSGDAKMVTDCCSEDDTFYKNVERALSFKDEGPAARRKKSKKRYCSYAYDKDRPNSPVEQMMDELYPTAADYIRSKKEGNYKAFSWAQQQEEASIFIDGVFLQMERQGLLGLTLHDGIFCRKEDQQKVKAIIEKKKSSAKQGHQKRATR
ncbi:hypothetical protein [Neorhodopirellula lusitana]|uniref:hypothetical protein n=1 Tax=Neorhodopirellula lusitana TaxID=445327 RepID=UPI00384D829B